MAKQLMPNVTDHTFVQWDETLKEHPGVAELLQAYAPYEAVARLTEQYLAALTPGLVVFRTDNTTATNGIELAVSRG